MRFLLKHLVVIFFVFIFLNNSYASEKNSYFIGHAYGSHGNNHIPDKSLKNFLKKHKTNFIIFGGDLTENAENFEIFYNYFKNTNFLAVRGNHDDDLFKKIPYWHTKRINGKLIYNLDMNSDMIFDSINLQNLQNNIIVQHYLWYVRLFSDLPHILPNTTIKDKILYRIKLFNAIKIPIANSMYQAKILDRKVIKKIKFGKNNIYLAGDCGAYKDRFSYVKTLYKNNTFICSGIGSGWADNVVNLNTLEPIFFDNDGNIIEHVCKKIDGHFNNLIEFCLPNHNRARDLWRQLEETTN